MRNYFGDIEPCMLTCSRDVQFYIPLFYFCEQLLECKC